MVGQLKLADLLKVALDETRMQMLGLAVFLGFQLNAPFQSAFTTNARVAQIAALALYLIIATWALIVSVPCQHRIVENGEDDPRIFKLAQNVACVSLLPLALAIACDIYVVLAQDLSDIAVVVAASVAAAAFVCWYLLGYALRHREQKDFKMPAKTESTLHVKIDQMLTEARVILPGAQALLGFQLIVTMTQAFAEMSFALRLMHFGALLAVAMAIVLLLAPAAVHRIAYNGMDNARFHGVGSMLVTVALAPLAVGIAADTYVATLKMLESATLATVGAVLVFVLLFGLWYVAPLVVKYARRR